MYLLSRYFNERLLYRVSVSQYKDNFLLKGGSLLYALEGLEARPTIDIDFMANRISRDFLLLFRYFNYSYHTVKSSYIVSYLILQTFKPQSTSARPISTWERSSARRHNMSTCLNSIPSRVPVTRRSCSTATSPV